MTGQTQKCKSTTSSVQAHGQNYNKQQKNPHNPAYRLDTWDTNKSNNMNFEHNMTKLQTFTKKEKDSQSNITDLTSSK